MLTKEKIEEIEKFDNEMWQRYKIEVWEYLDFLFDLRDSGTVNMFGAVPELLKYDRDFADKLDKKLAKEILLFWMKNFKELQEYQKQYT